MSFTSNLAESITLDAVNFSMNKLCKANIIISGAICSGKMPIAEFLRMYFSTVKSYHMTLMNQASFYKPLNEIEETKYGYNVDSPDAFYITTQQTVLNAAVHIRLIE